jgi:hypothetical protein
MRTLCLILAGGCFAGTLSAADKVDFTKQIQPLLQEHCVKCHGPEKQKGKLRLDSKEAAFKGGSKGAVLKAGKADDSDLYKRIILPKDHDDRMPSEGEPLAKAATDLIRDWINQGADWPETASAKPAAPAKPAVGLAKLGKAPAPGGAEQKALSRLEAQGMNARPIALDVNWRELNLALHGTNASDATLAITKDIPSLVHLNLRGTKITDAGLASLKGLTNLVELHLELTGVSDAGLAHLKPLANLTYLNLYGTKVSDAGLEHLKGLKDLQSLYLWQTRTTSNGVARLQKTLPAARIDTGWDLAALTKIEEDRKKAEEAKKKAEEEKKKDAKKEEKKAEKPAAEKKADAAAKPPEKKADAKPEEKKPQ